jgi:tripartite-type tricarboxylate transporter receptor subunit TctC
VPSSVGYIRTGKLRALASTAATRSEALPDVPTVSEFVPGYEARPAVTVRISTPEHYPGACLERQLDRM